MRHLEDTIGFLFSIEPVLDNELGGDTFIQTLYTQTRISIMNNIKVSTKSKAASSNVCLMVFIIDKLQDYWLIGNKFFVIHCNSRHDNSSSIAKLVNLVQNFHFPLSGYSVANWQKILNIRPKYLKFENAKSPDQKLSIFGRDSLPAAGAGRWLGW